MDRTVGHPQPVALVDFDHTTIQGDLAEAFLDACLVTERVPRPPAGDWRRSSRFLTAEAAERLNALSRHAGLSDATLPTRRHPELAEEIMCIYFQWRTTADAPAFTGYDPDYIQPAYAWSSQLFSGYTPHQIRTLARQVIGERLAAGRNEFSPYGRPWGIPGWLRIQPKTLALLQILKQAGVDIWLVSSTMELLIRTFAEYLAVPLCGIIGCRLATDMGGRLTPEPAHWLEEGSVHQPIMPFKRGKAYFIRQEIIAGESAVPVIGIGDSLNDFYMLKECRGLRIILGRRDPELQAAAARDGADNWLVEAVDG
ncbi:MAG: haloacid dehalogenase-like hydrolase [Acidobacteria bacterium]|nr:haloacid dehalogenase-like hydrolase [Acidobacteriota bacterium]